MTKNKKIIFRASAQDFEKIPGAPVAYWVSGHDLFHKKVFGDSFVPGGRNKTHDNEKYLRYFWEISRQQTKWIRYANGGEYRKYFGNESEVIDWSEDAKKIYDSHGGLCNSKFWGKEGICWTLVTTNKTSFRVKGIYSQYSSGSPTIFHDKFKSSKEYLAFLNSPIATYFLNAINPTINTTVNDVLALPLVEVNKSLIDVETILNISKSDWDRYETSWDFQRNPLIGCSQPVHGLGENAQPARDALAASLADAYTRCRAEWARDTVEMHRLEEENNRIFIDAYGLQDELTPDAPWNEITLTCNPWYRYGVKVESGQWAVDRKEVVSDQWSVDSEKMPQNEELERRLLADTIKEFISYAVGCMMGRYSLDKPGLILANQGDTLADYYRIVASGQCSVNRKEVTSNQGAVTSENANALTTDHCTLTTVHFHPDEDGVIPVLDEDWFDDDIVTRFHEFLKVTYGEESFHENMTFIEEAIGKDLRSYFTKDFYKEHLQRYHNRPIYWLFSSPKGAFSALVYMHRYRPETAGIVLTYLRSHITKVTERIHNLDVTIDSADSTAGMKSKAIRERSKLQKNLQEMEDYERDVLYPLSTEKIAIDLDDGVKVNYQKFGKALRKVTGLDAKEE